MTPVRFLPRGAVPAPGGPPHAGSHWNPRTEFTTSERFVSSYKVEQRRLNHRGREFHFVSYDAQVANERRGVLATPPMWYLMNEGKRRPVLPHVPGQELGELDGALLRWVDEQIFRVK